MIIETILDNLLSLFSQRGQPSVLTIAENLVFSQFTQVWSGIFTIYASIIWYFHNLREYHLTFSRFYASIIWYFHNIREYNLVFSRFTWVSSGIFTIYASIIWYFHGLREYHLGFFQFNRPSSPIIRNLSAMYKVFTI